MKNKLDAKKLAILIIAILLIAILGFGLYTAFNKKDSGGDNNTKNNTKILSVYQSILDEEDKEYLINGKTVTAKVLNGDLYVNGEKVPNVKADTAEVTEQVIMFTYRGKCHDIISYVVDKDGKSVPFTKNNYQFYDFRMFEDNCVAAGSDVCPCLEEDECMETAAITFTYTGTELVIK